MGEDDEDGKKNCDKNKAVDENTTQHDNRARKNKNESVGDDEDGENKKDDRSSADENKVWKYKWP